MALFARKGGVAVPDHARRQANGPSIPRPEAWQEQDQDQRKGEETRRRQGQGQRCGNMPEDSEIQRSVVFVCAIRCASVGERRTCRGKGHWQTRERSIVCVGKVCACVGEGGSGNGRGFVTPSHP